MQCFFIALCIVYIDFAWIGFLTDFVSHIALILFDYFIFDGACAVLALANQIHSS